MGIYCVTNCLACTTALRIKLQFIPFLELISPLSSKFVNFAWQWCTKGSVILNKVYYHCFIFIGKLF